MNETLPTESDKPADEQVEMPLPSEFSTVFLGGLFALALLAALYVAREIVLPVVLAVILHLVLWPAVRMLERFKVPRMLAAALMIALFLGAIVAAGTALSGPARTWAAKLPEGVPRLEEHLSFLREPVGAVRQFMKEAQGDVGGAAPAAGVSQIQAIWTTLPFTGMWSLADGLLETVLVLFFLLLSGNTFLRRVVEILPKFKDKRQAIEISQQIEQDDISVLSDHDLRS